MGKGKSTTARYVRKALGKPDIEEKNVRSLRTYAKFQDGETLRNAWFLAKYGTRNPREAVTTASMRGLGVLRCGRSHGNFTGG